MKTAGKPQLANIQNDTPDVSVDGLVGSGRALQRVQTQYTTAIAVQKPRVLERVQAAVLKEATLAGTGFFYSMRFRDKKSPTGFSVIEGPSIDGAMILARNFGNCASDITLDDDAPQHWIFRASFVDLETGFTESRLFRQRKSESHGNFDQDRKLDMAFQIGQSKAKRNVILKAMPEWLIQAAMGKAKEGAAKAFGDLKMMVPRCIDSFAKLGVTREQLERRVGNGATNWTANDLVTLAAIMKAIKDGQSSAENEFADTRPADTRAEEKQTEAAAATDSESVATEAEPTQATDPETPFVREGFE
jgi:hypothetical protein